ncbi:alpha-L-rhamnosidase [Pedobacter jejuensis]|uniref:alpha-L-rhamnosidase n=1 Tax=Pedobacter jejuensis TaxID=1268550 RepID=A0A3N0C2G5_9SPHI|nr:alpha-L-rhamnosidase [Pedobacter jejuensis]RNL56622.1 alpha-L-rhamnosidase [Pedobacter jejuensis]
MKFQSKILFLLSFVLFAGINANAQGLTVGNLLCEYKKRPVGVDVPKPILNWQIKSSKRNVMQGAYRILVADDSLLLAKNTGNIWDTKKVTSDGSIQIRYSGKTLLPAKNYFWKVMVWDKTGGVSSWSKISAWQTGLFVKDDWKKAQWIGYEKLPESEIIVPAQPELGDLGTKGKNNILPLLRKEVVVKKQVKKATVFISGLGHFELSLNGTKVGDHFLDPGWTKYDKHAQYVAFDITKQIKSGSNAFGVMLGNGFYYVLSERYRKLTGAFGYPKMICRIAFEYNDGSTEDVVSDNSWKTIAGPITFSSIYGGEDYDANLLPIGWDTPRFDDKAWRNAAVVGGPEKLDVQAQEPLKLFNNFKAVKITQPKPGLWVYDFGQNASGIPFINVKGLKGKTIKLIPGELLASDGTVTQNAIGSPVFFNYTLNGAETESWQPKFMYYGFRYLQIEGAVPVNENNGNKLPVVLQSKLIHTRNAAPTIGTFTSSNILFNKTFDLIDWAIKSNMASVFTDCPHREKLGWLEEAHLVGSSIRYTYDIATLSKKVISDMRMSQTADGLIPDIAPEYSQFGGGFRDSPEWGSNGIILPWYVYQWYGDKQVLEENYDMMSRYINYLGTKANNNILTHGLGDWYDIGPKTPGVSQLTPKGVTATAIYYYDLTILAKIARALGKPDDEKKYEALGLKVKSAFNKKFFYSETNQYATGSQTANAMALYMNLTEPDRKQAVLDNLIKDLKKRDNSLTSGDIGYRYLLRALDDAGRSDVIFDMNSRSDVPGYGYQIARGATALTESWQANNDASNNHFMLGHLMEWFYSGLAGIRADENDVASGNIEIRPEPVGDVTFVKASYNSPRGLISVNWKKEKGVFNIDIEIPANSKATLYLPANESSKVFESGTSITTNKAIKYSGYKSGKKIFQVGSGNYHFQIK